MKAASKTFEVLAYIPPIVGGSGQLDIFESLIKANPDIAACIAFGIPIKSEIKKQLNGDVIIRVHTKYPVAVLRDDKGRIIKITEGIR